MDLKNMRRWIDLTQNSDILRALVNAVASLRFP